jgi:hypothetical protein
MYILKMALNMPILFVLGGVGLAISVQAAIWIEPPGGIIYRIAEPVWQKTGNRVMGRIKVAGKSAINKLR